MKWRVALINIGLLSLLFAVQLIETEHNRVDPFLTNLGPDLGEVAFPQ